MVEIALIVEHATSGGKVLPHALDDGRIVEVWEDGEKRQPKETSFSQAVKWLMQSAFEPISFTWTSKAGPGYRRRKCVYKRKEEKEMSDLSPQAQKARRESAGKTRRNWARANAARARAMKPHEARLIRLATAAEKRYPELNGRAQKAAELVRRGHVQHNEGARFSVCSQDGDEIYLVDTERRRCTCYDHKSGQAPRINDAPMCKHRAACLMWLKVQAPDPARLRAEEKQFQATLAAQRAGALLM